MSKASQSMLTRASTSSRRAWSSRAAVVFVVTGGHVIFLPLLFLLPLGGLFGHRTRHGRWW